MRRRLFGQMPLPGGPAGPLPPGGAAPPIAGAVPTSGSALLSDPLASDMNTGRTAYDQVTAKHTILRTTLMTPTFPDEPSLEAWYASNSTSFQTLVTIALPLTVDQIVNLFNWLETILPGSTWTPPDVVSLIQKQILGQNVSFPEVELPARIIRFLSSALRVTLTGSQETALMNQRDNVYLSQFNAMDALTAAQAALVVATANTAIDENAYALAVTTAQSGVTDAQAQVQAFADDISSLNSQLTDLRSTALGATDLAEYLIDNLPQSAGAQTLSTAYYSLIQNIAAGNAIMNPLLANEQDAITDENPFQDALASAQTALIAARAPVNAAINAGATPDPSDAAAYAQAETHLTMAQNSLAPLAANVASIQAQMQAAVTANPTLFPEGQPLTDPTYINTMVTQALTSIATSNPSDLMTLIQNVMAAEAQDADTRITNLEAEQATLINQKQEIFQSYFQAQANAQLQFFQDQITAAQQGFNGLNDELNTMVASVQTLQDQLNANIALLGDLIGWWTTSQNLSADVMSEPSFIQTALTAIQNQAGKGDQVIALDASGKNPTPVTLWNASTQGSSAQLAGNTLTLLQSMNDATTTYEMNSPALIASLNQLNTWMEQTQAAYQVEYDLMNSESFMQQMVSQFNSSPQGQILGAEVNGVVAPLQALTVQVNADQEIMEGLLNDIEQGALSGFGVTISDFSSYTQDQKQNLWVGVCDYLQANQPRWDELQGYIAILIGRQNAPLDGDAQCLVVAQIAVMNIIGAQLIQRQLAQDTVFQNAMQAACDQDAQAALNLASGGAAS